MKYHRHLLRNQQSLTEGTKVMYLFYLQASKLQLDVLFVHF